MFCDRPQDFIPYARVEIIREAKDTDRMEATVFDGPIWMQVIRAKDFFEEVIQRSYTVREEGLLGHRMVYNWPETTFAELLTNAVLHRLSAYADKRCYWKSQVMRSRRAGPQAAGLFHARRLRIT